MSKLDQDRMCYLEPLFLWQPYLCNQNIISTIGNSQYLNVGDSHYIGHPKTGNGLYNHLKDLKDVFYKHHI